MSVYVPTPTYIDISKEMIFKSFFFYAYMVSFFFFLKFDGFDEFDNQQLLITVLAQLLTALWY